MMSFQLPLLIETLIRKHRLRSRANPQEGLREIGACLRQLEISDPRVVEFYMNFFQNTSEGQLDYGSDLLAIEFDGQFYDTRSIGKENIALNFAKFSLGEIDNICVDIRDDLTLEATSFPTLEENHPMLKTARAFLATQQADALGRATVKASTSTPRHRI